MPFIFDYTSYKKYLKDYCNEQRGNLSRLAVAGDIQKSYLSACINGKNQITLDHAYGMALYMNLSEIEQNYFFLLVEKDKALTPRLQKKLSSQLKEHAREAYRLKNQQVDSMIISGGTSGEVGNYYLNWLFTAIHSLTSIPSYQTAEKISARIHIPTEVVKQVLKQLENLGFVVKNNNIYKWSSGNVYLEDGSPLLSTHHGNWRMRALDNCQKGDQDAIHYSVVQTMSLDDFELLKKKIANFIKSFNKISDPSFPEESFCFNIDFFKI